MKYHGQDGRHPAAENELSRIKLLGQRESPQHLRMVETKALLSESASHLVSPGVKGSDTKEPEWQGAEVCRMARSTPACKSADTIKKPPLTLVKYVLRGRLLRPKIKSVGRVAILACSLFGCDGTA